MNATDLIAAARDCLGTPFMHQGRAPRVGLDCAGLLVHVAQANGLPVIDCDDYARTPSRGQLELMCAAQPCLTRVNGVPQAGDVLLMRFANEPQHLALCTGAGVIHAYEAVRRVVEHDLDTKWRRRIVAVYRFSEVVQ